MENTINERLKILIQALKLSARGFSAVLEVPESNTRNYLDKNTKLNSDYLARISDHFKSANLSWLITGEGEPLLPNNDSDEPILLHQKNNSGQRIKNNHGTANNNSYTIADCEKERDTYKSERDLAQKEVVLLREQLTMKDQLLAAKDEMLTLLRGNHNRPN